MKSYRRILLLGLIEDFKDTPSEDVKWRLRGKLIELEERIIKDNKVAGDELIEMLEFFGIKHEVKEYHNEKRLFIDSQQWILPKEENDEI